MKILTLISGALVGAVLVFLLMTTVPGAWATNQRATLCQDALARRRQAEAKIGQYEPVDLSLPYRAANADVETYCK